MLTQDMVRNVKMFIYLATDLKRYTKDFYKKEYRRIKVG